MQNKEFSSARTAHPQPVLHILYIQGVDCVSRAILDSLSVFYFFYLRQREFEIKIIIIEKYFASFHFCTFSHP